MQDSTLTKVLPYLKWAQTHVLPGSLMPVQAAAAAEGVASSHMGHSVEGPAPWAAAVTGAC